MLCRIGADPRSAAPSDMVDENFYPAPEQPPHYQAGEPAGPRSAPEPKPASGVGMGHGVQLGTTGPRQMAGYHPDAERAAAGRRLGRRLAGHDGLEEPAGVDCGEAGDVEMDQCFPPGFRRPEIGLWAGQGAGRRVDKTFPQPATQPRLNSAPFHLRGACQVRMHGSSVALWGSRRDP